MMFKKIYIEITNICNLNCNFCLKTSREKKSLSMDEFKYILGELKPYTKYLYFHVLGEPLLHQNINEFIDEASNNFFVNITTNGYLIKNIKSKNLRQVNISLHSFDEQYGKNLESYLNDIYTFANNFKKSTYINYRLWVKNKNFDEIINFLQLKYNCTINCFHANFKLDENIFLSFEDEFTWPENNLSDKKDYCGFCHALTDHVAILSNGTVVPCCLDGSGIIDLGNIFEEGFDEIVNGKKYVEMKNNLHNGIRNNLLCKKCNFMNKRS